LWSPLSGERGRGNGKEKEGEKKEKREKGKKEMKTCTQRLRVARQKLRCSNSTRKEGQTKRYNATVIQQVEVTNFTPKTYRVSTKECS